MTHKLHSCAADGCDQKVRSGLLMCVRHWKMVPRALQRRVNRTFRAMLYGPARDAETVDGYKAALRDAITAVREKEIKRALRNQQHGDLLDFNAR